MDQTFLVHTLLFVCLAAFAAGFIDAIVGGGGLVQTPALFILLPGYPVATILGTTKIPSFAGTSIAAWQYARKVSVHTRLLLATAGAAFVAAMGGSYMAGYLSNQVLKPVILVILTGVAVYTYRHKQFGQQAAAALPRYALLYGGLWGLLLGFYDGFIGPGTGSFLILVFIGVLKQDFLHASAHAKLVNLSTNIASILYFSRTGHILYQYAVPMALCNIGGSFLGTRMALLKGNRFIRLFFLLVVTGTILRFAWDIWKQRF